MAKKKFNVKALVNIKHDGVEYKENEEFILYEKVSNELQERGYIEVKSQIKKNDDNSDDDLDEEGQSDKK